MTVIIYDSPEVTTLPLPIRSGWIRSLYPMTRVIEAWDGPSDVGYTSDIMRSHEEYIIDTLGVKGITHFYSSEPYGEHMSAALGAVDCRVDMLRKKVPVSASLIRSDAFTYREYVHPLVYRDLIINVVFLGAPSTGKTTLARSLAREFNTQWMPEYGREYWDKKQVNRRLTPENLVEIAEEHIRLEDVLLEKSNRYLFTDTNAITTATFARYYHGRIEPRLVELANQSATRYDLTIVCDTDVPYEDTWDRSGKVKRDVFQRQVIADLNSLKVPYIVISGTIIERISIVKKLLSQFKKYMNVYNICRDWN